MKRRIMKKTMALLLVGTIVGGLAGCGEASNPANASKKETAEQSTGASENKSYEGLTIRVATGATSTYRLETTVALGYLEDEFSSDGISIEYIETSSGPAFVDAVAAEQVDLGIFGDQPLIAGYASGKPVEIIASFSHDDANINLVARPDSGIKTPADLKGKTVSYQAGTTEEKTLRLILEKEGLTEDDVEMVNLSDADAKVALESGDVDAHVFFGQVGVGLINDGYTLVANIGEYAHDVQIVAASKAFVEEYPELAARFLQVLDRTNQWIADNREEAVAQVAELREYDLELADQYYDLEERSIGFTEEDAEALNITAKFLYDSGLTEELYTSEDFVDTTYLELAGLK
ncbi:MAG: ABC transporter substrate-binding protein [Agathobacter sp.]